MVNRHRKRTPANLGLQATALKEIYSALIDKCVVEKERLVCIINIQPTYESQIYKIKIVYKIHHPPEAFLISPNLQKRDDKRPSHLHSDDAEGNPSLCVYYPGYNEWDGVMLLAKTFVPWISTWLFAYENWLITGKWHYPEIPH